MLTFGNFKLILNSYAVNCFNKNYKRLKINFTFFDPYDFLQRESCSFFFQNISEAFPRSITYYALDANTFVFLLYFTYPRSTANIAFAFGYIDWQVHYFVKITYDTMFVLQLIASTKVYLILFRVI